MGIEETLAWVAQSLADSRAAQAAFEEESRKKWLKIDNTLASLIEHQALFDENFHKADERFAQAEKRMDRADERMDRAEARMDRAERRMDRAEKRMDRLESEMVRTERVVAQASRLVTRLAVTGRGLRSEMRRSLAESNARMTRVEKTLEQVGRKLDALTDWQGRRNGGNGKR
ncbi:MAG TPA: hypothetical protein VMT20_05680 [Terriglobia bacterium]|nr:hypothetical protein [Terriglobia bacterium]